MTTQGWEDLFCGASSTTACPGFMESKSPGKTSHGKMLDTTSPRGKADGNHGGAAPHTRQARRAGVGVREPALFPTARGEGSRANESAGVQELEHRVTT